MYKLQGHNLALSVQHWYVHLAQFLNRMRSDPDNLLLKRTTKHQAEGAQSEVQRHGPCLCLVSSGLQKREPGFV